MSEWQNIIWNLYKWYRWKWLAVLYYWGVWLRYRSIHDQNTLIVQSLLRRCASIIIVKHDYFERTPHVLQRRIRIRPGCFIKPVDYDFILKSRSRLNRDWQKRDEIYIAILKSCEIWNALYIPYIFGYKSVNPESRVLIARYYLAWEHTVSTSRKYPMFRNKAI